MYSLDINDDQRYEFCKDKGLEIIFGKYNAKGEYVETAKFIANFWTKVLNLVEVRGSDGGIVTTSAELVLIFTNGDESEPVTLPLKSLSKTDWASDVDIRCLLNPDAAKANEHIANIIRALCNDTKTQNATFIDRLGTHVAEGIPVFNRGDVLTWPEGLVKKPTVKWQPTSNTRLVVDHNYSEQDAYAGMQRIIDLSPETGRLVFSFNILNVLREVFIHAGVTPRSVVYVYGFTGIKKSTYTNFQSHIYNRDKPLEIPARFNASVAASVKLLYEKSDCLLILDDLFLAQDSGIHKHQEKTLLEMTRVIGDGVEPARMRGQKVSKAPPRCGVLFTGEYCIGKGSDAARMLPVRMTIPVDSDKLAACQREPLMLSTFYHFFIKWYISNFDSICELLKEWAAVYRSTKTGIHDRLQETQFCLEAAYKLYLTYRIEKEFISKADSLDDYDSFYTQLRALIVEQNDRVNQVTRANPDIDYLAIIRTMLRTKRFKLAESIKDFEIKEHDGIIHKEHLYLRREKMMNRIRAIEPAADFAEVLDSLDRQGAFKPGKDSKSRQVHGGRRNLRFYAVKLAKLQ